MIKMKDLLKEGLPKGFEEHSESGKFANEILRNIIDYQDKKKLTDEQFNFVLARLLRMLKGSHPDIFKLKSY